MIEEKSCDSRCTFVMSFTLSVDGVMGFTRILTLTDLRIRSYEIW